MIYPLFISPKFLIELKDNEKLMDKFSNFVNRFKEYWNDIFILIDDEENSFTKKFKEIKQDFGHESYDFFIICDLLINSSKTKTIKLNKKFKDEDEIINFLKIEKKIKNLVTFPKYFEEDNITLKNTLHKVLLSSLSEEEALQRIISVTRFSKKIVLIDPNLADALTNFSHQKSREHKNDCTQIKSKINDKNNDLIYSLNKIIKSIYASNLFQKDIKIQIRTTLNHSKLNHFKFDIIDNYNKWKIFEDAKQKGFSKFLWPIKKKNTNFPKNYETLYDGNKYFSLINKDFDEDEESYNIRLKSSSILNVDSKIKLDKKKEAFSKIGELLKSNMEICTTNILKNLKPEVIINEHYKNIKKNDEAEQDIYFRHILAVDLRSSMELRKRLDIFDAKTKKLKKINSWYLNLEVGPDEKNSAFNIFSHSLYKPEEINFNR